MEDLEFTLDIIEFIIKKDYFYIFLKKGMIIKIKISNLNELGKPCYKAFLSTL